MSARQAALDGAELDLLSWAEARGSVPTAVPQPGAAPELSAARRGLPPEAARRLRAVLGRSPLLAFVQPAPEPGHSEPVQHDESSWTPRPARAASRRSRPAGRPVAIPGEPPAARETLSSARRVPSARVASRLAAVTAPPRDAHQPYRQLRRVAAHVASQAGVPAASQVAVPAAPAFTALPSALQRALQPLLSAQEARASSQAHSLDALLLRALRSPGRTGRLEQAALPVPGGPASLVDPVRALRAALPGLRSPLLSFLAQIAEAPAEADPSGLDDASVGDRPRRGRAARPVAAEPVRAAAPRAASTARALLRAAPERTDGSVLPRAVVRGPSADSGRPLSDSAFPGRSLVAQTLRQAGAEPGRATPTARSMRAPWLPLDRLVRPAPPEVGELPQASDEAPPPGRPVSRRGERSGRPARQAAPPRAALSATARAAARLLEAAPTARAVPATETRGAEAPTPSRSSAALRGVAPPARAAVLRDTRPVRPQPETVVRAPARALTEAALPRPAAFLAEPPSAERWAAMGPEALPPSGTERALARLVESISIAQATSQGVAAAWAMRQGVSGSRGAVARMFAPAGRAPETLWLQWRASVPGASTSPGQASGLGGPGGATVHRIPGAPSAGRPAEVLRPSVAGSAPRLPIEAAPWSAGLPTAQAVALAVSPLTAPAQTGFTPGVVPGSQAYRRLQGRTRPERRLLALAGRPTEGASVAEPAVQPAPRGAVRPGMPRRGRAEVTSARAGAPLRHVRPGTIDALLGSGVNAQVLLSVLHGVEQPDTALQVVLERALGLGRTGHLPAPVQRLVDQVREGAEDGEQVGGSTRKPVSPTPARESLRRRRRARSARRSAVGEPMRADATVHHVQANFRIAGLVSKLEQLIHLVDVEHRLAAARAQVRMAEDSASARPSPGSGAAEEARDQQAGHDVDALVKRIVEDVQDQIGQWSQQRPDDPAADGPWW